MYKIYGRYILRLSDNAYIPILEGNADYQEYLQWLASGNTPEPQSEFSSSFTTPVEPRPSIEDRVEAAETIIDLLLMEGE